MIRHDSSKEVRLLLAFFGESRLPQCTTVTAEKIPEPYRWLLVHENHMTETLETHHRSPLAVHPYDRRRNGELYGRKLDLTRKSDGQVVMTGLMIINLKLADEVVAEEILAEKKPLGQILVEHNVLRQVSPGSYLRFEPTDPFSLRFADAASGNHDHPLPACYGRLATIYCNQAPAVDLLEIVAP